ncbi:MULTISPECIES: DUF4492 domain-containing protein [Campylobacter]|uniref:DUF4492 domain-containing protein n=2 Tax=Campylobacter hominis TaxID=76517 RepID=A7I118_CAMHC|nr:MULTISPECIES: DUF4492 domain-containing protein [Campylobacter]ABS51284.1 conserved hypothetical protein [Campylobacter hominis ATCC BAA-381]MCI6640993.1 DUF4492 domain-containing protein [Campylobacter sp.]MDD7422655.1 DUF4492 domain-containing protein [Campylobacter hominis]MDY3117626.1 DUF4492 domain-containing protein [Campylobacter hominis]UAK86469.1 DUF4492 domain-containing protein [Campylobacter hominis]
MSFKQILKFYIGGFRNMKLGKTLWLIVLIKIAVIILIFKMLFFNETINTKFDSKNEKINFVYENLIKDVK